MSNKIKSSKVDMIKLIINSLVGFHICISCCSFRTSKTAAIQSIHCLSLTMRLKYIM